MPFKGKGREPREASNESSDQQIALIVRDGPLERHELNEQTDR